MPVVRWSLSGIPPKPSNEFTLNTTSFNDKALLNNTEKVFNESKNTHNLFIGIHQIIQVVLAQEKHKVARQEVTEGTFRMTKVRLETHIAAFFHHTDLR